ncbi:MAG: lipocalin-like domain-containing protein [Bradyrhizobium sp.]|nr:lipocalin-like domain-containing protein [Bradyrhizobium sp.]
MQIVDAQQSFEANGSQVLGIWKLVSQEIEVRETGRMELPMGENPSGYAVFTKEGRVFFILTGELREAATNDEQRAGLLNTLVAYTGTYRVEGDKWITKVEVAWNPEWVGSEQARFFKLDGDRLKVLSPWRVMPNWPDKGMTRSILSFERSK